MNFKEWVISEEIKDTDYYRNIVLSKLGLNNEDGNKSIRLWDANKLIQSLNELGEYVKLPQIKKKNIESQIQSRLGTINDLIKRMAQ